MAVTRHGSGPALRVNRPAVGMVAVALVVGLGGGVWALVRPGVDAVTQVAARGAQGSVTGTSPAPAVTSASATTSPPTSSAGPTASTSSKRATPAGLTSADAAAGLRSTSFPQRGTGRLKVVHGSSKAPGPGRVVTVRVEVEGGLDIDGEQFADFALATLNDRRSWARDGRAFARTQGRADVRLVLASPDTSARMCLPLRTFGRLSCNAGDATVLTVYRWVRAIPGYGTDRTGYRRYLVNHEVGHALGHAHASCPGPGRRAPVMMQQTKGLLGCTKNPWPYP